MKKLYAFTGRILRIDLSSKKIHIQPTSDYLPEWIGGRGIATKIAWDEISKGTELYEENSPLIFMVGPLCGTIAPFSGRTTLCGLAPQGYPVPWFTRSSFGGHFGAELKYAGYDGIVIKGISKNPVFLYINNDVVEINYADTLWGLGIYETQQILMKKYGDKCRVVAIGQAGENRVRIAVLATETESASGQGGFGALMGSKNLKAIVIRGTRELLTANKERFQVFCRKLREEAHGSHGWPHTPKLDPEMKNKYGQRFQACTQQCHIPCYDARYYTKVPSVLCKGRKLSGQVDCIAGLFPGTANQFYNWNLGFEAGFEAGRLCNDMGINHWEILVGLVPWLKECKEKNMIKDIDGMEINFSDIYFWKHLIENITFRKGMGDILAEGGRRAAEILNLGIDVMKDYYPAWGYAGHWDGHGDRINHIFFPFWIVAAIQWAVDTRDPISSGHGYVQNVMGWSPVCSPEYGLSWERIKEIGEKIYGTSLSTDPLSSYEAKAFPAVFHGYRSVYKDSLPVDDQVFPRIFSRYTEDNISRIELPDGEIVEGTSFEHRLFTLATGIEMEESEFQSCASEILDLDRMLQARNYNRSRKDDELLIPYYEKEEYRINPLIGYKMKMDGSKFRKVLDEYYTLKGWDLKTGVPIK
ncbi:MAG: hypothetical protein JXA60_03985 [Candidatus Coatesbacteria bacterium]|nr:hypothetical protein [Candidatus Coatesbacteria bacterium]